MIETLAPLERRAGSEGERRAAEWIAQRLRAAGCDGRGRGGAVPRRLRARDEHAVDHQRPRRRGRAGQPPRPTGGRRRRRARWRRRSPTTSPTGPRLFRRAASPPRTTWNVVGACGDAERAAHAGAARPPRRRPHRQDLRRHALQAWLGETLPRDASSASTRRCRCGGRCWARPALVALGSLRGRRGLIAAGVAGSALGDRGVRGRRPQPDRPRRQRQPDRGGGAGGAGRAPARAAGRRACGCVLASCGAEEVIQGGIYGFARRHFPALDRDRTWFLNLETLGSPRLIMLEGEGPVVMEDYHDRAFRDLVARVADRAGAHLRRGMRARNSTDAVIPSRAGYPTATLASMNRYKAAVQLPPHDRHARERRLPHGAPGPDASPRRWPASWPPTPGSDERAHAPRRRARARACSITPTPRCAATHYRAAMAAPRGPRRVAGGLPVRLPRARARVGGVLPAHARRGVPRDDDRASCSAITDGPLHEEIVKNIINVNGDDHRRLRNLVNPALAPRAVARYRPAMRDVPGRAARRDRAGRPTASSSPPSPSRTRRW